MLAMGLEDKMVGTAYIDDSISQRRPLSMAVIVHTPGFVLMVVFLRLYIPLATSDLNATGRCRPTIRSRSSLRSNLQRVDMAVALGNGSAPRPYLPHSNGGRGQRPQSPYSP